MKLFDKRFVHFMWDDKLEGKTGFVSNDIECLHDYVDNQPFAIESIEHSSDESQPFETTDGIRFRFFYHDPNYEIKKAFNEGKKIQFLLDSEWKDIADGVDIYPFIEEGYSLRVKSKKVEYRVKPEEKKYRPYNNSAEMIADFIDRFKVEWPVYAMPTIWVKDKQNEDARFLIFAFYGTFIKFNDDEPLMFKELFNDYTYLDGSPVGIEVKE